MFTGMHIRTYDLDPTRSAATQIVTVVCVERGVPVVCRADDGLGW
jgi:hypothetical protein